MSRYSSRRDLIDYLPHILVVLTVLLVAIIIYDAVKPPNITEGTVTRLVHEPGHYTYITTFVRSGNVNVPIMTPIYDDPDWIVHIRDGDEREDFYITEELYNKMKVGDYFVADEKCYNEDSHKKVSKEEAETNGAKK